MNVARSTSLRRGLATALRSPTPTFTRALVASQRVAATARHASTAATWRPSITPRVQRSAVMTSRRSMFIQTENTPNEDSLKFIPGVEVMSTGSAEFLDTRSALSSPLAIRLMGIQGVRAVFYGPDFVTVTKDSEHPWSVIKPEVYSTLMEHFTSGAQLFRSEEDRLNAGPQDTRILDTDSETVAMIKELLDTRVRPAIQEDGGDIEYRGFEDGIVKLMLKGSCRGCSSSTVTLKSGIERMLTHYIPEVKSIEQVLDPEEAIAQDEFTKFEKRLAEKEVKKESNLGGAHPVAMECQSELNSGSVTVKIHFDHLALSTSFASTTTMNLSSASELALTQTPAPRRYTIGSRASKLATIQAEIVLEALQKLHPQAIFNLEYMTTEGDKNQSQALYLLGGKALWTKELEVELLERKIDLIVHSLKDVPTTLPPGCELAAILEREEPADCLVMKQGLEYKSLDELPDGSVIGTSSVRRVAQLRRLYPKLQFADVRGNLNTRLAKLDKPDGEYTAIILAAAGLMRLGFSDRITALLKPPILYHAVGQASLGVEIRSDDETTKQLISGLTHPESNLMCRAERACLKVLEGGCSVPVGVASSFERKEGADDVVGTLKLMGTVTSLSGTSHVESTLEAEVLSVEDAENLGARLARKLIDSGAKTILEEIEKAKKERQEQEKKS